MSGSASLSRLLFYTMLILCVVLSGVWAYMPLQPPELSRDAMDLPAPAPSEIASLDTDVFLTPLWLTPRVVEPPPTPKERTPPPPLRLQLVAIIGSADSPTAVVYDPDEDRLLVVRSGQSLGEGRVIERITTASVAVRNDAGIQTLALDTGANE